MKKRDFETYHKRFRDFEIRTKFSETHIFLGTIRHPCLRHSKPYLTSFLLIMTGIAGTVAACVWGAIAYKNRGPAMTTSRYLMRLRVIAQSCVVGSIMAGIGVTALQNKIEARSKKDQL